MDWGRGGCSGVGLGVRVDRVRGRRLCLGQVLLEGALAEHRRSGAAREWDALGAARLWMREKGSMTWEAVGGSATCTHTAVAPRSDGDFGAEMTTSMLPSLAGTVPTFTVVCFSDMMLIEFTRTYDGCISGNLGWRLQTTAEYYRALLLVTGDCAEHYYLLSLLETVQSTTIINYWRLCRALLCRAPLLLLLETVQSTTIINGDWRLCRVLLLGTGHYAEYYRTGYCRLRTTADPAHYWVLQNCGTTDYCALLLVTGDCAEYYRALYWLLQNCARISSLCE